MAYQFACFYSCTLNYINRSLSIRTPYWQVSEASYCHGNKANPLSTVASFWTWQDRNPFVSIWQGSSAGAGDIFVSHNSTTIWRTDNLWLFIRIIVILIIWIAVVYTIPVLQPLPRRWTGLPFQCRSSSSLWALRDSMTCVHEEV